MCLEPILHHSSVENYAKDIVLLNGLPLLMEIHNRFKDNIDINVTLCKILANICTYPELLEDVFRSGEYQYLINIECGLYAILFQKIYKTWTIMQKNKNM